MEPWSFLEARHDALELLEARNEALEALEHRNGALDAMKARNGALEVQGIQKSSIFGSLNLVPKWFPNGIPKVTPKTP